jgi:hypothetical protein
MTLQLSISTSNIKFGLAAHLASELLEINRKVKNRRLNLISILET